MVECQSLKMCAVRFLSETVIKPTGSVLNLRSFCSGGGNSPADKDGPINEEDPQREVHADRLPVVDAAPRRTQLFDAAGKQENVVARTQQDGLENRMESTINSNYDLQIPGEHFDLAEKIWNYMLLNHPLRKSDLILVLGNIDVRVAEYAAQLWLQGYAEWFMVSGHLGNMTRGKWTRSEADVFREVALRVGVPDNRIITENDATNTGENIRYSFQVLHRLEINPRSIILVQMPFMERRTYATFMKQWPGNVNELTVTVSSPPIPINDYPNAHVGSLRDVIAIMLGCLQRIREYPQKGYQIYQDIPDDVWQAYTSLRKTELYNNFSLCRR